MLHTIDGREIRADKKIRYEVIEVSPNGQYVFLDEVHADGKRYPGPTVTAAEWHDYSTKNRWIPCTGSGTVPTGEQIKTGYWTRATCRVCGRGVTLTKSGLAWSHTRPAGMIFVDGVQSYPAQRISE